MRYKVYETCGMRTVDHVLPTLKIAADYIGRKATLARQLGFKVEFVVNSLDDNGNENHVPDWKVLEAVSE